MPKRSRKHPRRRQDSSRSQGHDPSGLSPILLDQIGSAVDDLHKAGEHDWASSLAPVAEALGSPSLRVVVFGQFSRGKSTLINALLGRIVLPAKAQPTTGHVTRLIYGPDEEVRVHMTDGSSQACDLDQIDSWATLDMETGAREAVASIDVAVSSPMLRSGIVLTDTPGIQEAEAQTERAIKAIALADLVLFVLHAGQLLHHEEEHLALDWMVGELGKPVVPVVNWMQTIEPDERSELRRRVSDWSERHIIPTLGRKWYEVDAMSALRHRLQGHAAPTDDYFSLLNDLDGLVGDPRLRIQRGARQAQLCAMLTAARETNRRQLARIESDREQVVQQRERSREDLVGARKRLNAQARAEREQLARQVSSAFADRLERLCEAYAGEQKERLEESATDWFSQRFAEALTGTERAAEQALQRLCPPQLRRPEPLTVTELMVLGARLDVDPLADDDSSGGAIGGAVAGAIAASFIPIIGTFTGAIIGGILGAIFGSKEPDYGAAYAAKATEVWNEKATQAEQLIMSQLDARVRQLRAQISRKLKMLREGQDDGDIDEELRCRQAAERTLSECTRGLRDLGRLDCG